MKMIIIHDNEIVGVSIHMVAETELDQKAVKMIQDKSGIAMSGNLRGHVGDEVNFERGEGLKYHIRFTNGRIAGPYNADEILGFAIGTPTDLRLAVYPCFVGPDDLCECEVANLQKLKN